MRSMAWLGQVGGQSYQAIFQEDARGRRSVPMPVVRRVPLFRHEEQGEKRP